MQAGGSRIRLLFAASQTPRNWFFAFVAGKTRFLVFQSDFSRMQTTDNLIQ
jgi:hypothetical protein